MSRLIVLGNCVAERLAYLLARAIDVLGADWRVVSAPLVFHLKPGPDTDALATRAAQCDLVFSQPLFSFGACNTAELGPRVLAAGKRFVTFAAPNFEAYFPDVLAVPCADSKMAFSPPLDWHSSIIAQCFAMNLPEEEATRIYPAHPLFRERAVALAIERSLALYEKREQNVDINTLPLVRQYYSVEPMFHTWNHPAERLLLHLLDGMLEAMGLTAGERQQARAAVTDPAWGWDWSFGFNRWPVITRHHKLFAFAGRESFRIAGVDTSLEDTITGYYNFYRFHPQTLAAVLAAMEKKIRQP